MNEFSRLSSIRGYHVYKDIWDTAIGEMLACEREPRNAEDHYAVAVKKDETIIGLESQFWVGITLSSEAFK